MVPTLLQIMEPLIRMDIHTVTRFMETVAGAEETRLVIFMIPEWVDSRVILQMLHVASPVACEADIGPYSRDSHSLSHCGSG